MKNFLALAAILMLNIPVNNLFSQDLKSFDLTNNKSVIGLNYIHPFYYKSECFSTTSGMYELFGTFKLNENLSITANIPYLTYTPGISYTQEQYYPIFNGNRTGLGNISLGINYLFGKERNKSISGILTFPTTNPEKVVVNFFSMLSNNWDNQKYIQDYLHFNLSFHLKETYKNYFYYGGGLSNRLMIPTGEEKYAKVEDWLDYHITGGYDKLNALGYELQIFGFYKMTNNLKETLDISEVFVNFLKFGISYHNESIKPKLFLQVPINNDNSKIILANLYGLELQYLLGLEFQCYLN